MIVDAAGADRRRTNRTTVCLETDIRFEGLDCTGFTADVSVSGAFVRANDDADPLLALLNPGDWVELRVELQQAEPLAIPAKVVRKLGTGVGFEFMYLEPRLQSDRILGTLAR